MPGTTTDGAWRANGEWTYRARRAAVVAAGAVALAFVAWGLWRALRLPDAPPELWARSGVPLDPKPFADACLDPGGAAPAGFTGAWFEPRPGRSWPSDERWNPSLLLRLDGETPLARRALGTLVGADPGYETAAALYRATQDRRTLSDAVWVRYVRLR